MSECFRIFTEITGPNSPVALINGQTLAAKGPGGGAGGSGGRGVGPWYEGRVDI